MLAELKIENVAIIESAEIRLSRGFNVLTGETGAGKSIILDSINTALGERASREILRSGADSASVTALFTDCGEQVQKILADFEIDFDGEDDDQHNALLALLPRIPRVPKNIQAENVDQLQF